MAGLGGCTSWIEGFSGDPPALKGERGRVLELWDLGDKIVDVGAARGFLLREALVLAWFVAVAVAGFRAAVLARFFGLARSCWVGSAVVFAVSSGVEVEIWSLDGRRG